MRIVWLSANRFGYELLKAAMKVHQIDHVITLAEDSGTVMYDSIETGEWQKLGIPVRYVKGINSEKGFLASLEPDIVIMAGWRQIIDIDLIAVPKKGFIGFHPTLLPVGRGPAPIINSILNGFTRSGVTMFYIAEGLDNGDVIGQKGFTIEDGDHAHHVYDKTIKAGRSLIKKYLPMLIAGNAPRKKQDGSKASIFAKPSLKDNRIDLENDDIEAMHRKIRALSRPYKGAYIEKDGKRLIIWDAELVKGEKR